MANSPGGFVAGFLHFVLKLFLASIALVFAVCLIAVGLVAMIFSLLKALVTWQKPAPWVVFRQVQKYSARGQWAGNRGMNSHMSGGSGGANGFPTRDRQSAPNSDVVDVEVREVSQADAKQ